MKPVTITLLLWISLCIF
ncbi:hypothetical protein SEVIR_7G209550v4 [Setaria viridis]